MKHFSDLLGETIKSIVQEDESIIFEMANGKKYRLYHEQDCCENVFIESIVGELSDLVGSPLTLADESLSDYVSGADGDQQWTFYRLATIRGYVNIRWCGGSNGYYSISVDFEELP